MNFDASQLSLFLTVASALAATGFALIKGSMRLARLELKVETIWLFQMRRGFSEVINTGIGKIFSPMVLDPAAKAQLDPIKDKLIAFWNGLSSKTDDAEAMLQIEDAFGDDLMRYSCIPCGLSYGACLILALAIAKQSDDIVLISRRETKRQGASA